MNNDRRKRLRKICEEISAIMLQVEEIRDDEQYAFDNLPFQFAESERGEAMQDSLEALENAANNLYEVEAEISRAMGEL